MARRVAVLDASAILAVLFRERGSETVLKVIEAGAVTTPTGLAEALTVAQRLGHRRSRSDLVDDLTELGLDVEPLLAQDAAEMAHLLITASVASQSQPKLGSLSLGDAACLSVATRLGLPVVVSDGTWEALDLRVKVLPFR